MNYANEEYVLLVDDDLEFLSVYSQICKLNNFPVLTASNGEQALDLIRKNNVFAVVSDIVMPKMDGIELLKNIKEIKKGIQVIMLTGEGSISGAVDAVRLGAFNYMVKPAPIEDLLLALRRAKELYDVHEENISLKEQVAQLYGAPFVGDSEAIRKIKATVDLVAETDSTVLITGESGTGKEIVANMIQSRGHRSGKPFIKVNCAALAEGLLESELFGHEKGAFTGALKDRKGRFEMANNGTLFLDEISEIPLSIQVKLLRVLQEREFERLGDSVPIKTDFQLIAATNINLIEAVQKGTFREDLFYRINVVPIFIPPLRERKEDIPLLLDHFLNHYSREIKRQVGPLDDEILSMLMDYSWPGNARELKNIVERMVVFSVNGKVNPACLPPEILQCQREPQDENKTLFKAREDLEKALLGESLKRHNGNITEVAKELGLARKSIYKKMNEYGIRTLRYKK